MDAGRKDGGLHRNLMLEFCLKVVTHEAGHLYRRACLNASRVLIQQVACWEGALAQGSVAFAA